MEYDIESILEKYEDDYNPGPRPMNQGPRNMYNQGQLVQPNNDGSRPGYAGDDVTGEIPEIYDDELLKKRISIGRTGPTSQAVTVGEIFERVKNVQGGPELISDFKKNPTESKFISLRKKYKNRVKTERVQNLSTKEKAKFRQKVITSEKKWRASEKGQAYYNKLNATKGIFPANTPQERVWRDIYRAASQKKNTSRFQVKYPKNIEINPETGLPKVIKSAKGNMYIPWDKYHKQISFYDTKTGSTIKFGNMREWMKNNVKGGGKKYDNAIGNYKIRQSISDFDIGGQSLGDTFKQSKSAVGASPTTVKLASPSAVNHISGLDNFWDTEITTSTGNKQLNDKVQSKISAYQNSANPMKKEKILKQMKAEINKIKGGATLVVDGETIGKKPTIRKVGNALSKELEIDLLKFAATITNQCSIGNAEGGRIGFNLGANAKTNCLKIAKEGMEKGLANGFKKSDVGLAQKILGTGKFLKDAVSLRGLFGPAALAFTAAAEAGIVGYDMLSTGKSFKEAVGDSVFNYMLGDKTKIDSVKERNKRMIEEGMTPEQMGKIGAMESALEELNMFGSQFNKLAAIQKNREAIDMSPEDTFNKGAFQLDLDKQEDAVRENIQDFNRTGGPQRLQNIDYAGGFENLAEGLRRNELAQLQSVDNPLQSRRGDEKRAARIRELMLQNPDVRNYMGSYPTNYGFKEGGIASLNVNKK